MSINRPKRPTFRKADNAGSAERNSAQAAKLPKWKDAMADHPEEAFVAYAPSTAYRPDALLVHPKFGKGLVVGVEPGKVAILFEEGVKKLVHAG
jgi:hypothetical protein